MSPDGRPLPLRTRDAEQTPTGFQVRPPADADVAHEPAYLAYAHGEVFDGQENITILGRCRNVGECIDFDAQSTLNEFILPANPLWRAVYLISARRRLRRRLEFRGAAARAAGAAV